MPASTTKYIKDGILKNFLITYVILYEILNHVIHTTYSQTKFLPQGQLLHKWIGKRLYFHWQKNNMKIFYAIQTTGNSQWNFTIIPLFILLYSRFFFLNEKQC
jgi:hypothetical protein